MWDEEDGFFYDVLRLPDGRAQRLKVRSMVGSAAAVRGHRLRGGAAGRSTRSCAQRFQQVPRGAPGADGLHPRPAQARSCGPAAGRRSWTKPSSAACWRRCSTRTSSSARTASARSRATTPSIRTSSASGGQEYRVSYLPAESDTGMFGGNSNWRGPIWMPVNALIIRALLQYYAYYGDDFTVECPTGSGRQMNLYQVAEEIARRLASIFLRDEDGRRPVYGGTAEVPGGSALARLPPVLRVLPRRQRRRPRRQPPDRLDRRRRPRHAPVRDQHGRAGPRARQDGRGSSEVGSRASRRSAEAAACGSRKNADMREPSAILRSTRSTPASG